jgi:hypothetical protein
MFPRFSSYGRLKRIIRWSSYSITFSFNSELYHQQQPTYKDTRFNKHPILKINCNSSFDLTVSNYCHRYINNTVRSRQQRLRFVFALETDEYLQFQIFYAAALWEITRQWHTRNLEAECNRTPEVTEEIKRDSFKQRLRKFTGGKYRATSENFYQAIPTVINTRT